jgi:hypothetical protein
MENVDEKLLKLFSLVMVFDGEVLHLTKLSRNEV